MKAFVTGSSGLLGSNLVQLLLSQGYEVIALVRSLEKGHRVLGKSPKLTFVQGDMENVAAFESYLIGCDVLFHTAAYFREHFGLGDHWPKLERINVQGTIELLEAAATAGVKKVIYVSSSGCLGLAPDGSPSDETTPPSRLNQENLYFRSKLLAEVAIADFLKTHTLPVVLILPGAMLGPSDAAPTEMGLFIVNFLKGEVPFVLSGGFSLVDVRDVALAMLSAVKKGKSGERYLVGGRYTPVKQIVSELSVVSGKSVPLITLPDWAMKILAWFMAVVARVTHGKPDLTVEAVRIMLARQTLDSTKARQALDVSFRPLTTTFRDTVHWYQENNYV